MTTGYIFWPQIHLQIATLLQNWWFFAIVLSLLGISAFIFHRLKINALKRQKGDLERQFTECCELKQYAVINEQKAREEAELANRNKRELLGKISHEIRTPMNAMWGMASLLKETSLSGEQNQYTTAILSSGESLLAIINDILMKDILQYSKVESGKELESKDFDLHTAIEEVLDVFAANSSQTGLDLLYRIDDDVPACINGDAQRLRQILTNLVENAFRFTVHGEICVCVHLAGLDHDDRLKLEFEVRDTGCGMSPEKVQQLSEDLMQTEAAGDTAGSLGLSLVICKRLVHLMGGTIRAESREKEGSAFRFTICSGKSRKQLQKNGVGEMTSLANKRVLITDDNITSGKLLKRQLSDWKMQVVTAVSGDEALKMLSDNHDFDLVLADLHMPGLSGIALAEEIKKNYPGLPVILLNKTGDENFRQYPNLFKAVINKPVRRHLLTKELLTALKPAGDTNKPDSKLSADFSKQYPLNILIAEDDAMNQQMALMVLKKLGYKAQVAANGKEVLEIVSHSSFDVILMDVQMPEMDGLEATRMIRLCLDSQPVIIAMTANTMQGDREACLEAGMNDYLSKPVKLAELVSLLEKWASQEQQKQGYRAKVLV